jgi:DNA polymerase-1
VASGDRDSYQLASRRTTIVQPIRAGELARIGPAEVRARYGVDPAQVPDFIALRGDSADRIPGAAGVGPVGAASLLERFGTLEKMLAAGRYAAQAKKLLLYKSIATMDKTAPLPPLRNQKPSWDKAAALAHSWRLNKLAERLAGLTQA